MDIFARAMFIISDASIMIFESSTTDVVVKNRYDKLNKLINRLINKGGVENVHVRS